MCVFVLMAVEAFNEPHVQNLVGKSAASPPPVTVGHHCQRPVCCTCPVDKGQ